MVHLTSVTEKIHILLLLLQTTKHLLRFWDLILFSGSHFFRSTRKTAAVLKLNAPAIITLREVILARYDQSEHAYLYNRRSNYTL